MSDCEKFIDYSLCDPSPLDYDGEGLTIGQFLEPLPHSFEPNWPTTIAGSTNFPALDVSEPERQRSSTRPPPLDNSTVWVDDLIGSSGFFAPLPSEVIADTIKPFNGQIPVEDTYSADVKRYMKRTGKVPNINVFTPEDGDFECVHIIYGILNSYEYLLLVLLYPPILTNFWKSHRPPSKDDVSLRFQSLERNFIHVPRLSPRLRLLITRNLL